LKVGGYVQYDLGVGDIAGQVSDTGDDTYYKRARFQLRIDARTETELGTLRGYAALDFQFVTGGATALTFNDVDGDGVVDPGDTFTLDRDYNNRDTFNYEHIFIELAGFRIGKTDSFFTTWTGYASGISRLDGLIAYGPFDTHQISYTWDGGNGFSIGGAVENGHDGDSNFGGIIQDYAPHAVLGAAYKGGIFGVSVVGAYDSVQEEFSAKGRIDVTPTDMISFFIMGAWTDDDNGNGGSYYATWGGDWAVWAGGALTVNDRLTFNAEFGYNDFEDYSAALDANITVVPGLVVTPGVFYTHGDGNANSYVAPDDSWGANLRTRFTF
jgi:hypothetical protein